MGPSMSVEFLKDIILDLINGSTADNVLLTLDYTTVFNCVDAIKEEVGLDITPTVKVVFSWAVWLLILKFVWKGFDTYLLGLDGDEDADPMKLLFQFVKAIVISLSFGLLFDYFTDIASSLTNAMMTAMKMQPMEFTSVLDAICKSLQSLFALIMVAVYIILAIVLNVMFIKSSIELVILRVGIAFSTVGLMDSDGGVFKPYVKKFFQIAWAVAIRVICFKLSLFALSQFSFFWAFAFISMAMTAPQFLQEFIMVNQGGGGKLQQALYSFSILRSFRR